MKGVDNGKTKIVYAALAALAYYSFEQSNRILLFHINQTFNFIQLLLASMSGTDSSNPPIEIPASTRYAAAVILNKLLTDKSIDGVIEAVLNEGVLTYIYKILRDNISSVKKEAISIIISLLKFIDERAESFKPLVPPLISALGDGDEQLVLKALECLRFFSFNERLNKYIVENGCASILCTYVV